MKINSLDLVALAMKDIEFAMQMNIEEARSRIGFTGNPVSIANVRLNDAWNKLNKILNEEKKD
jgi:hypothetical protein